MSDIFISYASADRDKAKQIASVLEARGHSVWWDRTIPPGRVFDEVIQEALNAAKCAIVLWSKASVNSSWVKTEAAEAGARNMLVPAMIEPTPLPLEFKRIQTADLVRWDGEPGHPELLNLVASVEQLVHGETPPPRAVGTVSPRRAIPRFVLPAIALVLVVASGWFAYEYMTSENAEREPARAESRPRQNTGRESAESEPNDRISQARPVALDTELTGRIANPEDRDFFIWKTTESQSGKVRLILRKLFGATVHVYDSAEEKMASGSKSGDTPISLSFEATANSVYYFLVKSLQRPLLLRMPGQSRELQSGEYELVLRQE